MMIFPVIFLAIFITAARFLFSDPGIIVYVIAGGLGGFIGTFVQEGFNKLFKKKKDPSL